MTEKKYPPNPPRSVLPGDQRPWLDTGKILLEAGTRSNKVDPTVMQAYDWKRLALLMQLNLDDRLKETRKRRGSKNKNRKHGREALKGLFGGGE